MNKADRAEELFRKGYNCSQSVFVAFAEELGMSEEEAARMASPFGAGFGKLREVCGARLRNDDGSRCSSGILRPGRCAREKSTVCAGAEDVPGI